MSSTHEAIYDQLRADGHIGSEDDGAIHAVASKSKIRTLQATAADPKNRTDIAVMKAHAHRLGVSIPEDQKIDIVAIEKQIAGKSIEDRMTLKSML
jgi:hypothetical protein